MGPCNRCGEPSPDSYELHDYCAVCYKNLCDECMANGCCGHTPALSGEARDHADREEEEG